MENAQTGTAGRPSVQIDQSLPRNRSKSAIMKVKLLLIWLAVGLPFLWGVMKAVEDVRYLFE